MNESEELRYSPEASATRSLFYQGLNDINLYIEDSGLEYEYETIFKRLLKNNYRITAIFSLGGKNNVKKRFDEFGGETDGIKNFYIVDGDFDRYIAPDKMIHSNFFIYLNTYNIENYFIDQQASEQFAKSKLKCLDSEVIRRVDFKNWKKRIVNEAKKLFLYYCFIQKFNLPIKNTERSVYEFIDDKTGFERTDGSFEKYARYVESFNSNAKEEILKIAEDYEALNGDDYSNLICGKFLMSSLYCHLCKVVKASFKKSDFRWSLINNFDISKLEYVKQAILG